MNFLAYCTPAIGGDWWLSRDKPQRRTDDLEQLLCQTRKLFSSLSSLAGVFQVKGTAVH